ncbi:MAG: YceI family protein [Flavobacteriales bacterium]|nr:YceI family protein [Flavobacteriales bacterium]
MKRTHFLLIAAISWSPLVAQAQDKLGSRDGEVTFFSTAPLEDITAVNHKVASVFVPSTGAIEFSVLIKAFEFEKALMQEHFNENYLESNTFPKALFKGRVVAKNGDDISRPGVHAVVVEGDLTIHGVSRPLSTNATLEVGGDGKVKATCTFDVKPEDHGISVPSVVRDKIAKTVKVSVIIPYTRL